MPGIAFSGVPPATQAAAIVLSDTVNFGIVTSGIYVGKKGNISVALENGQTVVFKNVLEGAILDIRAVRVNATGTTAVDLIAIRNPNN